MTDLGNARDAIRDITRERALGQQIHVFANTISGHYYRRSEVVLGISLAEWRVLRSVLTNPGTSQAEIAVAEGLNVMNVSRAVAGLRRKRLVEAVTDPDDGRRSLLSATELGIEIGGFDSVDRGSRLRQPGAHRRLGAAGAGHDRRDTHDA